MIINKIQFFLVTFMSISQNIASEIPTPVFKNALYSDSTYKAVIGDHVICQLQPESSDDISEYILRSILTFQNNESKHVEYRVPLKSASSLIQINTNSLNASDTYNCCLEVTGANETVYRKCSYFNVSLRSPNDFTLIAKIIGVIEMLVLILIFTVCLVGICLRFKNRQKNKFIKAELKELDNSELKKFEGPYIISSDVNNPQTDLSHPNPSFTRNLKIDLDGDLKTISLEDNENDFPPTYEELVLRKIESQIDAIRY